MTVPQLLTQTGLKPYKVALTTDSSSQAPVPHFFYFTVISVWACVFSIYEELMDGFSTHNCCFCEMFCV